MSPLDIATELKALLHLLRFAIRECRDLGLVEVEHLRGAACLAIEETMTSRKSYR